MNANKLVGLIMMSPDPERLADYYREVLGLPFAMEQHGTLREHIECEANGIHFAILKKAQVQPGSNLTPSFVVENLPAFLDSLRSRGITPLHPIIHIGDGKSVSTLADPDGNTIRLIQIRD